MSNVSIYGKKWIDLVFEDRNQMYGAYQLRQQNPKITLLALFYGVLLMAGFMSIALYSNFRSEEISITDIIPEETIIQLSNYSEPVPEVETVVKTTPPNTVTEPIVEPEINRFSHLTVSQSSEAVVKVPTNEELNTVETPSIIGTTAIVGSGIEPGTDSGKTNGNLLGNEGNNSTNNTPSKASEVDKLPAFPNGIENFYKYVASNFRNPDLESGAIVSVLVAFVVEKDGTLSNIRVLRNSGFGVDKEAIRVLSALKTKWSPGIKNGEKVRTEFTLPIKVKFN